MSELDKKVRRLEKKVTTAFNGLVVIFAFTEYQATSFWLWTALGIVFVSIMIIAFISYILTIVKENNYA